MTLEDFLRECKEKGSIPLSYSSKRLYVDGSSVTESFESKAYRDMTRLRDILNMRRGSGIERDQHEGKDRVDEVVSRLYGKEVMIRTPQGFHHGTLQGYDGKFFYLKSYCFSRNPMDTFEYSGESIFSKDAVVPAKDIISVAEIPMEVDETEEVR